MPFFSIITPTCNRPESLERAVASVLRQGFSDFEYIIVNNGKEDVSLSQNDNRIKIISEKRKGANYARNTGIENATGDFICFLDDDDEYLENHLLVLHDLILKNNRKVALYRTFTRMEVSQNSYQDQLLVLKWKDATALQNLYSEMLVMHCVCCHRDILQKIKFDLAIPVAQDYHLWTRILAVYPIVEAPVITTVYHKTDNSISSPGLETFKNYLNVYKELFKIDEVRSEINTRTRDMKIFRYYYFILYTCLNQLSFGQFLKYSAEAFRYNPLHFFSYAYLKLLVKFIFIKIGLR